MSTDAERAGSPSRRGRRALLLLLLVASCGEGTSTGGFDDPEYTSARLIDRVCAAGAYELHDSAELDVGLTADSCAFVLGPDPGSVDFTEMVPAGASVSALIKVDDSAPTWTSDYGTTTIANPPGQVLVVLDLRASVTPSAAGCSVAPMFHGRARTRRGFAPPRANFSNVPVPVPRSPSFD